MQTLFHALILGHVVFGAVGLVAFWVPVLGRKGGAAHRAWGAVFANCLLVTGGFAVAISLTTLWDPVATHPHLPDATFVRAIFGVLMLHLSILTLNLAWYGRACVIHRRDHAAMRRGVTLALQPLLAAAALWCAIEGLRTGQPLMVGMSTIGAATVATNLMFMLHPRPAPKYWLREHLKGLVGAGISVYTAFFAFGAVQLMPRIALQPGLWAVPLVVGLGIIFYHWHRLRHTAPRPARP